MKLNFEPLGTVGLTGAPAPGPLAQTCLRAMLLLALLAAPASGQEFLITSLDRDAAGRPVIRHTADPAYYYILYRGALVTDIVSAVDMELGVPVEGQLADASPLPTAAFYRLLQVPVADPLDTDGDGIDDVWELRFRNPGAALNPDDANEDHTGSGTPDLQEFLDSLPLTAWFAAAETSALSYEGAHTVEVHFTRPVTGMFAYEIGGDAVAGRDYAPLSGELLLDNSGAIEIPIQIQSAAPLRGPRSIVLTLKRPGSNVVSRIDAAPSEGRATRFSSHVVTIRDADQGLYAGTLTFLSQTTRTVENGETNVTIVPAPPVAASGFQMALRSGSPAPLAVVELPENLLFPDRLSIPVTLAADQFSFNSSSAVAGVTTFRELQDRLVSWQFEFTDAAFTSEGRLLDAECRITLNGLTASGIPQILTGTIFASRIDP
ncbi:MAG TPA: hypothetical protein VMS21_05340 [Methylomirabilota bacterium]|nr:hypothetical protein [Methylomirabilota bacterium]